MCFQAQNVIWGSLVQSLLALRNKSHQKAFIFVEWFSTVAQWKGGAPRAVLQSSGTCSRRGAGPGVWLWSREKWMVPV